MCVAPQLLRLAAFMRLVHRRLFYALLRQLLNMSRNLSLLSKRLFMCRPRRNQKFISRQLQSLYRLYIHHLYKLGLNRQPHHLFGSLGNRLGPKIEALQFFQFIFSNHETDVYIGNTGLVILRGFAPYSRPAIIFPQ